MGMELIVYAVPRKKWHKKYYHVNDILDECGEFRDKDFDNDICWWGRWNYLCTALIDKLSVKLKDKGVDKYEYFYKMSNKDIDYLESIIADKHSNVYAGYFYGKKAIKKYRKMFLEDIKNIRKHKRKGESIYFEASI